MNHTEVLIREIREKISELEAQLQPRGRADNSAFANPFLHLFSPVGSLSVPRLIPAYTAVVDNIKAGFENKAEVRVYQKPKSDVYVSPPEFRRVLALEVDDIRDSSFLSFEVDLPWDAVGGAATASLSMAGLGTWGLRAQCMLRFHLSKPGENGQTHIDKWLMKIELGETRSVYNGQARIEIPAVDDLDKDRGATLILFFEPRNFRSEIHYILFDLLP